MEGNLFQAIGAVLFCGSIVGLAVWQLISTSLAKKRRIVRELEQKARKQAELAPAGEWIDGGGI